MDIVQNYAASDICNRPNIGAAIKGRTSTAFPAGRLLFCIALFIFPGVITVRHQRSWCAAAGSGLYFQQCVIRHALTPVVYFCDVYSPRENKKKNIQTSSGMSTRAQDARNYTDDRESATSKNCGVLLFCCHEIHRAVPPLWHSRKDRL